MKAPFCILVVVLTGIIQVSGAEKGIADYFRALPPQTFTEDAPTILLTRCFVDSRNGYMFLQGDGAQVSLQVALFLYPNRRPLLAVAWAEYLEGLEEPPYDKVREFTHLSFFTEREGKMVSVDRAILPIRDSGQLRFELPRIGLTLVIRDPGGKVLSKWTWNRVRFTEN